MWVIQKIVIGVGQFQSDNVVACTNPCSVLIQVLLGTYWGFKLKPYTTVI